MTKLKPQARFGWILGLIQAGVYDHATSKWVVGLNMLNWLVLGELDALVILSV